MVSIASKSSPAKILRDHILIFLDVLALHNQIMQLLLDNCSSLITEKLEKLNGCFSNFFRVCQVVIAVREKQALNPISI